MIDLWLLFEEPLTVWRIHCFQKRALLGSGMYVPIQLTAHHCINELELYYATKQNTKWIAAFSAISLSSRFIWLYSMSSVVFVSQIMVRVKLWAVTKNCTSLCLLSIGRHITRYHRSSNSVSTTIKFGGVMDLALNSGICVYTSRPLKFS